jgi:histone H3/H4
VINAPQRSLDQLRTFAEILKRAIQEKSPKEEIVAATRAYAPELEEAAEVLPAESGKLWLSLLVTLYLISKMVSVNFDVNLDIKLDLNEALETLIEAMGDDAISAARNAPGNEDHNNLHEE